MPRIALATAIAATGLDDDLAPLLEAFARHGVPAEVRAWDDFTVSWKRYDLVLLRSTWDYTERRAEFLDWCARVEAVTTLCNPSQVVRWNTDKHYLRDLADGGVPLVAAHFVEPGGDPAAFPAFNEFVVKPAVGAGSRDTRRYLAAERDTAVAHVARLIDAGRSALVQPYVHAVDEHGETGLVFIEGRFSHAIRKGPLLRLGHESTTQLFAVEDITARLPSDAERAVAQQVLAALPPPVPLYARVDLLPAPTGPLLLELELVEPSLFFATAPGAADRLTEAALRRLESST